MRLRVARMHPCSADRLHCRLKDAEYAVIDGHESAARRLVEDAAAEGIDFLNGSHPAAESWRAAR